MKLPGDTTPEAWAVQLEILRRMTGPERVAMAFEMSEAARALSEAGIRHRHPEWNEGQVRDALMEMLLGLELANAVRASRLVRA